MFTNECSSNVGAETRSFQVALVLPSFVAILSFRKVTRVACTSTFNFFLMKIENAHVTQAQKFKDFFVFNEMKLFMLL